MAASRTYPEHKCFVLLWMVVSFADVSTSQTVTDDGVAVVLGSLDNRVFPDSAIFQMTVGSLTGCGKTCSDLEGCVTFTFDAEFGTCQGHQNILPTHSSGSHLPGARTWTLTESWLERPCTDNADCPMGDWECFEGKCLCTPGFYSSQAGHSCRADCPQDDLRPLFLLYPNSYIRQHNYHNPEGVALQDCLDLCVSHPHCRSVDYIRPGQQCNLQTDTALDVPQAWRRDRTDVDYYQRVCR